MLYIFHGNLQSEGKSRTWDKQAVLAEFETAFLKIKSPIDIKRKVLESQQEVFDTTALKHAKQINTPRRTTEGSKKKDTVVPVSINKIQSIPNNVLKSSNCCIPALTANRSFQALEPSFYVYSAYLDKRYSNKFVRIMAVLALNKANRRLTVFCNFRNNNGSETKTTAIFYELCENHGRTYGGFVLSCPIPDEDICQVNVSVQIEAVKRFYVVPETVPVHLRVSRLIPPTLTNSVRERRDNKMSGALINTPYNFSICVPPLFGDIDVSRFVEFIELNRILGFQHFIFYISTIKNPDMFKVLDYYKAIGIVTLIEWTLPSVIHNGQIWYNGQLSAHNDCLYRSMSLTQYLAIIDLDEFIVPHNGDATLTNLIPKLFGDNVCGLSFHSAFYDKKFSKSKSTSKLLTARHTGRSAIFSKVRTKVLVKPSKIFEVGIHHISKPAGEDLKVEKVDTSVAYLHHYRDCVPNYGMKCKEFVEDNTLLNVTSQLEDNVSKVLETVFEEQMKKQKDNVKIMSKI